MDSKILKKLEKENKRLTKRITDLEEKLTVAYMSGAADSNARNRVLAKAVKEKDAVIEEMAGTIIDVVCRFGSLQDITNFPLKTDETSLAGRKGAISHYTEKVRKK